MQETRQNPLDAQVSLEAASARYRAKVDVKGRRVEVDIHLDIRSVDGEWVITETSQTPQGKSVDRGVLSADGRTMRSRSSTQGPLAMSYEARDGKLCGCIRNGPREVPFEVPISGEPFADGPCTNAIIAGLPLEQDYSVSLHGLDLQRRELSTSRLEVVGSESVTVPAGTFDAFRVQVRTASGAQNTLWVGKAPRRVLKSVATAPTGNDAVMVSELIEHTTRPEQRGADS